MAKVSKKSEKISAFGGIFFVLDKFGDNLINRLAKEINRKGFEPRSLRLYRRIYLVYPQLGTEIGTYLHNNSLGVLDASGNPIWQSATAKLQTTENQLNEIWQSAIAKLEEWSTPADWLFNKLNYTSLAYLTSIEEPLKRAFYEQETSLILNSRRYASSSSDCDGLDGLRPPVFLGDNVRSRTDS